MSAPGCVLAVDQGTAGTRAIVFDGEGHPLASAQVPITQIYPAPEEVEQDPEEIWRSVVVAGRAALRDIPPRSVKALGITNQRETTIVWERGCDPMFSRFHDLQAIVIRLSRGYTP